MDPVSHVDHDVHTETTKPSGSLIQGITSTSTSVTPTQLSNDDTSHSADVTEMAVQGMDEGTDTDTSGALKVKEKANRRETVAKKRQPQLTCGFCKDIFDSWQKLRQHMKTCHHRLESKDKTTIPCAECGKIFKTKKQEKNHRLSVHHPNAMVIYSDSGKKYSCLECEKSFSSIDALDQHQRKLQHNHLPVMNRNMRRKQRIQKIQESKKMKKERMKNKANKTETDKKE